MLLPSKVASIADSWFATIKKYTPVDVTAAIRGAINEGVEAQEGLTSVSSDQLAKEKQQYEDNVLVLQEQLAIASKGLLSGEDFSEESNLHETWAKLIIAAPGDDMRKLCQ